jgi:hypothetical protein
MHIEALKLVFGNSKYLIFSIGIFVGMLVLLSILLNLEGNLPYNHARKTNNSLIMKDKHVYEL